MIKIINSFHFTKAINENFHSNIQLQTIINR